MMTRNETNDGRGAMSPTSDASLSRRFTGEFDRAIAEPSTDALAALRETTVQLARRLRETHPRPERALLALKALLRTRRGGAWSPSLATERGVATSHPEAHVYGIVFGWWVAAYFAPVRSPPDQVDPSAAV